MATNTKKKTEGYDTSPGVDVADILREKRLDALHKGLMEGGPIPCDMDGVKRGKDWPDIMVLDDK